MPWEEFCMRLVLALIFGCVIGFERQLRQRLAGMRTNTLVSVGSALFVMMGMMTPGESSPTRIAGQVASGIGFLGAGVIIRHGLNVRGLNTAATLWCSAAVGVLCGAGFKMQALVGTIAVLAANVLLRPLAQRFLRHMDSAAEGEMTYRLIAVCRAQDEQKMRALLMQMVNASPLMIGSLLSEDTDNPARVEMSAKLVSLGNNHAAMEQLVSRLSLEAGVSAVSWEIAGQEEI
ncbi:MAG: MgtC/SapB family protein [Desulfobaccales bacterium]